MSSHPSSSAGIVRNGNVDTASGRISYTEAGAGPVLLFVHGVLVNKHLWRHQMEHLSDIRRCIAIDLLAHGDTEIDAHQDVSVTANAAMISEVLDALDVDRADVVGNDSGGGICQIFAALHPHRIRTLTLTDCDTSDNWPPAAFQPFVDMALAGGLTDTLGAMLADPPVYRSPDALGPAYQDPTSVTDADIETYLSPFLRTEKRTHDLQRFLAAFDNRHTLAVEPQLRALAAPTLIVWGTDDVYFPTRWAHWLATTIPVPQHRWKSPADDSSSPKNTLGRSTSPYAHTCLPTTNHPRRERIPLQNNVMAPRNDLQSRGADPEKENTNALIR